MLNAFFGHAPGQLIVGFAIAQIEAGFQLRTEAIADIGCNAFAAACGMVLIAVGVGVSQRDVVIEIPEHLSGTDLAFLIAVAACFVAYLQRCGIVAGMGDVIDGAAQR